MMKVHMVSIISIAMEIAIINLNHLVIKYEANL